MASSHVRNRLSTMKDELDHNNEILVELDGQKKSLETQIIEFESEFASDTSKLSMLVKQLNSFKLEQEKIKREIIEKIDKLEEKNRDIDLLEGNRDEGENRKQVLEEESKTLAENIYQAEILLEDHERRLLMLNSLVEKREIECEKNQERIDRILSQLEDYKKEIGELERDDCELSEHEGALRNELREINSEYLEVDNEYDDLSRQRTSLEHEISAMNKKLGILEIEYMKYKDTINELMEGINQI